MYAWSRSTGTQLLNVTTGASGVALPTVVLSKPHGDATQPQDLWTLPHEPGVVSSEVLGKMAQLRANYARTLLIVGYSESHQIVVDELVRPLDQSWRTIPHRAARDGRRRPEGDCRDASATIGEKLRASRGEFSLVDPVCRDSGASHRKRHASSPHSVGWPTSAMRHLYQARLVPSRCSLFPAWYPTSVSAH